MRTLKITRKRGYYGALRALSLHVDGEKVGTIRQNQTTEISVPDDARELTGRMDWGSTKPFPLEGIGDGESLTLRAWFTLNPLKMIGLPQIPMKFERGSGA